MRIIKGTFRRVFLSGRYAVKVPRLRHFLAGCRCNRWEREIWQLWRPIFGWQNICPVLASDPWGLVIVMPRAEQPVMFEDVKKATPDCCPEFVVETKCEDFGRVAGSVVALDYGLWDAEEVAKHREKFRKLVPHGARQCDGQ